jgi:hypothetical protein
MVTGGAPVHAAATVTSLSFTSAAGDYIGQGLTESFDSSTATITTGGYALVGATAGSLWVNVSTATENWEVFLSPPAGQQLQPGTYQNALRAPFNGSSPGLSVSGDGRGCNNDYGSFAISQLGFASNGALTLLDADFTQHCESAGAPPLQGTVRYRAADPRPAVALVSSAPLSYPGQPVTLSATVTGPGAGTPTGTVSFWDGSTLLGSSTLDAGGRAAATTTWGAPGTHLLTASYGGDASHPSGASAAVSQAVESGGATSSTWYAYRSVAGDYVGQGAAASYGPAEGSFSLYGSSTYASFSVGAGSESWSVQVAAPSGQTLLPGTYANGSLNVSGDGRGSDSYGSFTIFSAGWDASGNLNQLDAVFTASGWASGQSPLQGVVRYRAPLPATATTLTASAATSYPGQPTTFTATVSSASAPVPAGSVTFSEGSVVLGTGTLDPGGRATLTTSFPSLGTHAVTAAYGGDPAHAPSSSAPVTETVQNGTTTLLSASTTSPRRTSPVTLSAVVTSQDGGVPTGAVTLTDNGRTLGTVILDAGGRGSLTTGFGSGSHAVVARYAGDATDQPSSSNTVTVTPRRS